MGSTRIVIILRTKVIKLPLVLGWRRFIEGTASNYKEAYEWGLTNAPALAEVFFCFGGLFLIAERADKLTQEQFDNVPSLVKNVLRNYVVNDYEFNRHNVGRNAEGAYKVIDYGTKLCAPNNESKLYAVLRKLRLKLGLA